MHCNTQLLEKKISESGYRITYIASRLGISMQAFSKKRKGETPFKHLEIKELQKLLNITDREVVSIFLP